MNTVKKYPWRSGWIGVDLDGTLAHYEGFKGHDHIGEPIPKMVERVRNWINDGYEVRIFTARVAYAEEWDRVKPKIEDWCMKHIGRILSITCIKDREMFQLWDDRAVQVIPNTGEPVERCAHE